MSRTRSAYKARLELKREMFFLISFSPNVTLYPLTIYNQPLTRFTSNRANPFNTSSGQGNVIWEGVFKGPVSSQFQLRAVVAARLCMVCVCVYIYIYIYSFSYC